MDKIIIKDLRLAGILGINPRERVQPQPIVINVVAYTDIRLAAASRNIDDAVNYSTMAERIIQHVAAASDLLVETLVMDIARLVLTEFAVSKVRVRVEKPNAIPAAHSVGIEIERTQADFSSPLP